MCVAYEYRNVWHPTDLVRPRVDTIDGHQEVPDLSPGENDWQAGRVLNA